MYNKGITREIYIISERFHSLISRAASSSSMALIKEYFALTEKYTAEYGPNTVVLLQVGAFFEVYGQIITPAAGGGAGVTCSGSRIDDFCVICELAKANKTPGFVMAGFRDYGLDKYLKKLQDAGYTAVVYVQDGVKNPPVRVLQGIYSPGTFFSTDIAGTGAGGALSNNIACIWIEKISRKAISGGGGGGGSNVLIMGMTNIDIYTGLYSKQRTRIHIILLHMMKSRDLSRRMLHRR